MIPVTKPFLPPKEEVYALLDSVWERQWLTNNGPLVVELEAKLKQYLNLNYAQFIANGTIALQIAIKALELSGEIITTPFSFIATSSCIVWEGCSPVFVDIDANTLNLNSKLIEAAITPKTTAILATHVYGNACNIDEIEKIAQKHQLKVIYDAAHCFGSTYRDKSIFAYGDISITSFHATKLFHTVEGGGIFTKSPELAEKISFLRNFGYNGPSTFSEVGINGKNSEFHAAMGLVNLNYINEILAKRKALCQYYKTKFETQSIKLQEETAFSNCNYAYFPIVFESFEMNERIIASLEKNNVFPRRYFYPSLNKVQLFEASQNCPVSESIAPRVLCLPLYHTLEVSEIDFICDIILQELSN